MKPVKIDLTTGELRVTGVDRDGGFVLLESGAIVVGGNKLILVFTRSDYRFARHALKNLTK